MHPDLMRLVDRTLGAAACALLSLVGRLRRHRPDLRSDEPPRRILFIGLAEIGALVVSHPALALARRRFPGAEICFLTFTPGIPMLRLMGLPESHIFALDPSGPLALARSTVATLRELRRLRVDASVCLEVYVRFSAALAVLSGARCRAGFHRFHEEGHYLGNLFTRRLVYSPHRHIAQSYMALVHALCEPADIEPKAKIASDALPIERLRLAPSDAERREVVQKLAMAGRQLSSGGPVIVLNANAGDLVAQRRWPLENYVELARRLLHEWPHATIVLTGTATERPRVDDLAARIGHSRVINLAGRTTLAELIALFDMSALVVTNDSGPAHFASTTDVPTLVLFGPETPRIFGPLGPDQEALYLAYACSPCVSVYNQKRSPCGDNRCMKDMSVDMVLAAARRHLEAQRAQQDAPL